jgi:Domain of unknown function (DUF4893)
MATGKVEGSRFFFLPLKGEGILRRAAGGVVAVALFFGCLAAAPPAHAGWRDHATPFDVNRFAQLDEARAKGLSEASAAPAADLAVIDSVLHAPIVSASPQTLKGNWRCRTIKLGGVTPVVIYSWFRCRIAERDGALFFEKLTGSQRTQGFLYDEGQGFVYLGASYVSGEKPHRYSGNAASAGAKATPDDQIGLLSLLVDGRARLELPYPVQESTFDVIELKR